VRIFIQIASYRDPQLVPTLRDLLRRAKNPAALRFGICRQFDCRDGFDDLGPFTRDRRFRVLNVPHQQSRGTCWARRLAQQFYAGEDFTLQIDSHMRFARNWDETLIRMLRQLTDECGTQRPILTTYPPGFQPNRPPDADRQEPPGWIVFHRFEPDGALVTRPAALLGWQQMRYPVRGRFYAGGFAFTLGRFCADVPYDPHLYFIGEEISMAVRAFTHGYDLFHPHRSVVWHYYGRAGSKRHWDDHPDWHVRNGVALARMRRLLGMERGADQEAFGRFGLGRVRSLRDYERFAGVSFARRSALR
jgi:hypothetical protein